MTRFRLHRGAAAVTLLSLCPLTRVDACTAIAVTKGASAENSTLIAHTDDAGTGASDVRLVRVPAQTHARGSQRAIYKIQSGYPRVVTSERGAAYEPVLDPATGTTQAYSIPLGCIPQVEQTYAYFDQAYGMMNEVQLSIGESTCGAKTVGWPLDVPGGHNLFGIAELTKVALERCATARCAIDVMGYLAETYGFYSEDSGELARPDYGNAAEALVIGDKVGEVWVFHVLTGKDQRGAVWAAQRVPDGHVTVLANAFTIRELDLAQPNWFKASSNVYSVAQDMGWWDPREHNCFDFTATYGLADTDAVGPLSTGRRIWRVFDVLAPSQALDARVGSFAAYPTYPFSIAPDEPVATEAMMELLRDYYQGTRYDLTKGLTAGPFGAPVRWSGSSRGVVGGWERPISMSRTLFAFVLQSRSRDHGPNALAGVAWYAQNAPHGSVFVPFSCAQHRVPDSYVMGRQSTFDSHSAWWAFNFVNNWSLLRFNAMHRDIRGKLDVLQRAAFAMRRNMEDKGRAENLLTTLTESQLVARVEAQSNAFADHVVAQWWQLAWTLVAKYSGGYVTTGESPKEQQSLGYPAWWLETSEFATWPGETFKPTSAQPLGIESERLTQGFTLTANGTKEGQVYALVIVVVSMAAVLGAAIYACAKQSARRAAYHAVA
ncbi:hypothetical protein PsorP6_015310 [Peronosclerospora sorghi]|uniref:Uncharacterized protein n=1 Tax=Peronosclerospora sorghi TaxID=230839 RepID=A0ACC0VSU3_9STRA|nr:hypothetical protein PsorP6_015310 [Peronosclerospora sorghi]